LLVALAQDVRIEAQVAIRSVDYCCPQCGAIVHVRRRKNFVTHFYHLVSSNCDSGGEGAAHLLAKHMIGEEYRRRGCVVDFEWTMQSELARAPRRAHHGPIPRRRADIVLRHATKSGRKNVVVVEVQESRLTEREFRQRMIDWADFGWKVLWLCLPQRGLKTFLAEHGQSKSVLQFQRYAIRPFERLMLKRHGVLWLMIPETACFFSVAVQPSRIEVPAYMTYQQSTGDFAKFGGYDYRSNRYVDLEIAPAISLSDIRIIASGENVSWT
jgi:competence CoiA-like predicted nuclease